MKDLVFVAIAGAAGVVAFFLIAKKFGSDCLP
jgi:hypothetical protein